ncbi:MAG: hypothetical protein AAGI30_14420 [Planctomycetota bacterium]
MLGAYTGNNIEAESPHNRLGTFAAAFVDGHASTIRVGPEDINALRQQFPGRVSTGNLFAAALNDDAGEWQFFPEFRDDSELEIIRTRSQDIYESE